MTDWEAAAEQVAPPPADPPQFSSSLRVFAGRPKGRPKKKISPAAVAHESGDSGSGLCLAVCNPPSEKVDEEAVAILKFPERNEASLGASLSNLQQALLARVGQTRRKHSMDFADEPSQLGTFVKEILQPCRPLASRRVQEEQLGSSIRGYHSAVSSSLFELGICQWSGRLKGVSDSDLIKSGQMKGLLFVKQRLYDETPLRLRHMEGTGETGITKVLQGQFRIAMLLQSSATKRLFYLHGYVPTILQALEQKKSEDIMCAQMKVEASVTFLNQCSAEFRTAVQLLTTDRDGTNMKAERGVQHQAPHFVKLHLPCDIHKVSACLTSTLNLLPAAVTGIINFGLLMRPAGAVERFRSCLMQEIESKFRVVIGLPPAGLAQKYRQEVYKMFLGSSYSNDSVGTRNENVRIAQVKILSYFLNGDLQDEDNIVWHAPFMISRQIALEIIRKYVPSALLPKAIGIFPRHRWHGCEIPVDQLGLLAAHHNLLKHATLRFLGSQEGAVSSENITTIPGVGWSDAARSSSATAEYTGPLSLVPFEDQDIGREDNPQVEPKMWEDFNKSVKAKVRSWVAHDGHLCLPVLRQAMTPAVSAMFKFLKVSSSEWDAEQEAAYLQGGKRKYRVTRFIKPSQSL